ncbi:hypothetical protein NXW09_29065 [Bacteroides ovatus]|nr:hypothetical protein [Bacteroides ovatus]
MANENKTQGFEYGAIAASLGMKDGEVKDVMARISELAAMEPKYRNTEITERRADRHRRKDAPSGTADRPGRSDGTPFRLRAEREGRQASRIETLVDYAIAKARLTVRRKRRVGGMAGSNFELAESTLASIPAREKISKEIADDPANIQATAEATKTAETADGRREGGGSGRCGFQVPLLTDYPRASARF